MKKVFLQFTSVALALASIVTLGLATPVTAQSAIQRGVEAAHGEGQPTQLFGDTGIITTVTNTLLFLVGALSVIMIIVGGFRYVTSGGNSASVTAAKNTILYAIVGLVIAFLAFAAVNWILGVLASGGAAGFSNR